MKYFYLLLIPILWGCSVKKTVSEIPPPPPPKWVQQKPIEPAYYSGIGMGIKSSANFLAIAKNNALNDLSTEISVQIKSTSMLYQVEQNEKFREEFKANTQLKSIENIEGFELMATYENGREYWVYYRLSKAKYLALKNARKEKAIAKAVDLFKKAKNFKINQQYDDALIYGIKSIEAVKIYLGDGLKINLDDTPVYLGNELFSFLNETVNELNIRPVLGDFNITRGQVPETTQLTFLVSTEEFSALADIPIYFYYSGHRIKNNALYSNHNGLISYPLTKITSVNATEYLQANLNMVSLTKEATDDPFVSKLVGKISGSEARIKINVKKPVVFIKSEELNFGEELPLKALSGIFKQEFLEASFSVTENLNEADYFLEVRANTEKISGNSGFYSAALNANIKFYDKNLNLLYTHQIANLKGVQLDYKKAGKDAYQKAVEQIEKRIFRELRRKVFD